MRWDNIERVVSKRELEEQKRELERYEREHAKYKKAVDDFPALEGGADAGAKQRVEQASYRLEDQFGESIEDSLKNKKAGPPGGKRGRKGKGQGQAQRQMTLGQFTTALSRKQLDAGVSYAKPDLFK